MRYLSVVSPIVALWYPFQDLSAALSVPNSNQNFAEFLIFRDFDNISAKIIIILKPSEKSEMALLQNISKNVLENLEYTATRLKSNFECSMWS